MRSSTHLIDVSLHESVFVDGTVIYVDRKFRRKLKLSLFSCKLVESSLK